MHHPEADRECAFLGGVGNALAVRGEGRRPVIIGGSSEVDLVRAVAIHQIDLVAVVDAEVRIAIDDLLAIGRELGVEVRTWWRRQLPPGDRRGERHREDLGGRVDDLSAESTRRCVIVATRQTASVKGKQTRDECQAQTEPTALLPSRHTTSGAATLPRYSSTRGHVLIVSWASGGNLPPLVTAGRLVAARDQAVSVLASAATRAAAVRAGFEVIGYRRAPAPNTELAFEERAAELMATTAGTEVALDVR